jgi:hypothetical protein
MSAPTKPSARAPKDAPPPSALAEQAAADSGADVGRSYALELQRHASKPLWRLRETQIGADGVTRVHATPWLPFPDWTPELLLARGRMQAFVFSGDPRLPREVARTGRAEGT